jgi:hypothetical protein
MIEYRKISWWFWAVTAALLVAERAGWAPGLPIAIAVSVVQLAYFRRRDGAFGAFPVQVRAVYLSLLLLTAWPPARWLLWLPTVGTTVQVLFGYCLLARTLSLAPWNRSAPVSRAVIWRTFTAPPVKGTVLQGL